MGLKVRIWISGVEYGPHSQNLGREAGGGVRMEEKGKKKKKKEKFLHM